MKKLSLLLIIVLLMGTLVACGVDGNRDQNLIGTWEYTLMSSWRFDDGSMIDGSISTWTFESNGFGSHRKMVFENGIATGTGTYDTFEWYTVDGQIRMRSNQEGNSSGWVTRAYEILIDDDLLLFDNRNTGSHRRVVCGEASVDNLVTQTEAYQQSLALPSSIIEYPRIEEQLTFNRTSITGVFSRNDYFELPQMRSNVRYYFHADNRVERWHFGNRMLNGTYSIMESTITLFRGDGTTEGTLTISPDGQTLWGMFTTYNKVSYTIPVVQQPSLVGRWRLTRTRGEFVPEELEFFEDGRKSSTLLLDGGELCTVWFYWSSKNGTLRYWGYNECESEAHEFIYVLYHWVAEPEPPGSRLRIRNLSGSLSDGFQRID